MMYVWMFGVQVSIRTVLCGGSGRSGRWSNPHIRRLYMHAALASSCCPVAPASRWLAWRQPLVSRRAALCCVRAACRLTSGSTNSSYGQTFRYGQAGVDKPAGRPSRGSSGTCGPQQQGEAAARADSSKERQQQRERPVCPPPAPLFTSSYHPLVCCATIYPFCRASHLDESWAQLPVERASTWKAVFLLYPGTVHSVHAMYFPENHSITKSAAS